MQAAVAVYLEDGDIEGATCTLEEPKQPHSKAGGLCVTKRDYIKLNTASALNPSSPCLRACFPQCRCLSMRNLFPTTERA